MIKTFVAFFKNRELRNSAKDFSEALGKHLRYRKDVLPVESYTKLDEYRQELKKSVKDRQISSLPGLLNKGNSLVERLLTFDKWEGLREQVEVLLVAVVAALAIRAYFYQPFKIPTDSMNPTLYGIQSEPNTTPIPNIFVKTWDFVTQGRVYHRLRLKSEASLVNMKECDIKFVKVWFDYTDLTFSNGEKHRVGCNIPALIKVLVPEEYKSAPFTYLREVKRFTPNDDVYNFHTEAGDLVLVNKWLFNFRLPHRGEVLVFRTNNIAGIESVQRQKGNLDSTFYIKRCVGLPGDVLCVRSPHLLINGGDKFHNDAIRRVESAIHGYRGYGYKLTPGYAPPIYLADPSSTYTVPEDGFWAMGDNSYNSLDSRFWGPVPRENIVGTGSLVWWPFSSRWGPIH